MPVPAAINAIIELTECMCELLALEGAGPTCWCGLYPGAAVSWEYCTACDGDTCGMGYVRLAMVSPYQVFPSPAVDDKCVLPTMWALEVGALRCMPTPHDGEVLDVGSMAEVAIGQMLDARALRKAIKCCVPDLGLGLWSPAGPNGACVGGYWAAFLDMD